MRDTLRLRHGVAAIGALLALGACEAPASDEGGAAQPPPSGSAAEVDPALRAKAAERPILVLARVRDDAAKDDLVAAAHAAGITFVEPWEEDPVVRLQVDAQQLDRILATGLVESIVEEPELQVQ